MVAPQRLSALFLNPVGFGISELTMENIINQEYRVDVRYKVLRRSDISCPQRQGKTVLRPLSSFRTALQHYLRHKKMEVEERQLLHAKC